MFILFGSPRSGTTLYKESLNLHSNIFIPNQTTFISPIAHVIGCISDWEKAQPIIIDIITSTDDYTEVLKPYISPIEIQEVLSTAEHTLAGVLEAIYNRIGRNSGKAMCGDKTPDDMLAIRKLEQVGLLNSNIKLVHIVRDVRGVMLSLKNVSWAPEGIEEYFPRLWNYTNLHLYKLMRGRPNYFFLRYEDLVSRPQDVLSRTTAFLDLPFETTMLDHNKRAPILRNDQSHLKLSEPFLNDRAVAWQSDLDRDIRQHCEASASEALQAFGYAL
ncbi:sulfotransferase [Paraburkholderia megapolitana]|uniref:sulfotransferase n=1 Tax=Paraburkholderia megapolitana TaxID=420953 RepID=UPI0038BCFC77